MKRLVATLFFLSMVFAEENEVESETENLNISQETARSSDEGFFSIEDVKEKKQAPQEPIQPKKSKQKESSLCMTKNCCEPYTRCCYPLPLPAKCGNCFLEGDYLYLKTYSLTPFIGVRRQVPPPTIGSATEYDSEDLFVPLDANSGYRATLGIYFSACAYFTAKYTQFETDGRNSVSIDDIESTAAPNRSGLTLFWLLGTRGGPSDLNNVTQVNSTARNRFRMRVMDFDFYKVVTCSNFSINPFIGARVAWVKTDLVVDYKYIDPSLDFEQGHHIDVSQHFNLGAGFHTGIDMNLDLCQSLNLYATSSFSAIVGQRNFRIRDVLLLNDSGPVRSRITENYKQTDVQFAGSFGCGFHWGTHFCKCAYYAGIKVGYEAIFWPNFLTYLNTNSIGANSIPRDTFVWKRMVFSHGLNAGVRFDF